MAFKVSTKSSVEFNGKEFIPEVTTELRIRIGEISFQTEEDSKKADKVLSECFPGNENEVLALLPKVSIYEKQLLRAYLVGGDRAVEAIEHELIRQLGNGDA